MPAKKMIPAQKRAQLLMRLWALLEKEITTQEQAGEVKSFATLVTVLDKLSELQKEEAKTPRLKADDINIIRRAIIRRLEVLNVSAATQIPPLLAQ